MKPIALLCLLTLPIAAQGQRQGGGGLPSPVMPLPKSQALPVPAKGKNPEATALMKQLQEKDELVRLKAAKPTGKVGDDAKPALPALKEALLDDDEDVRSVAKQAIRKIEAAIQGAAKQPTVAELIKDLKNKDASVRLKAMEALAAMG